MLVQKIVHILIVTVIIATNVPEKKLEKLKEQLEAHNIDYSSDVSSLEEEKDINHNTKFEEEEADFLMDAFMHSDRETLDSIDVLDDLDAAESSESENESSENNKKN